MTSQFLTSQFLTHKIIFSPLKYFCGAKFSGVHYKKKKIMHLLCMDPDQKLEIFLSQKAQAQVNPSLRVLFHFVQSCLTQVQYM